MKVDNQEAPNSELSADESYAGDTLGTGQLVKMGERKVLGVRWDPAMDQLILNLEQIAYSASRLEPTKRTIVSLVGCIYDPLGILSPVVISLKIFVQELCVAKMAWDQPLTGSTLEKWHQLVGQLGETSPILLSRCYLEGITEQILSYHLCGFCDASLKAYAAVVYLILDTSTQRHIRILASKTRVAPLKTQTIPRLELLSALLLARLMDSVAHALEGEVSLASPHCFSDSTVGSVEKTRPGSRSSKIESRRFEHYCHLFTGPIVLGKTILLICHQEAALTNISPNVNFGSLVPNGSKQRSYTQLKSFPFKCQRSVDQR